MRFKLLVLVGIGGILALQSCGRGPSSLLRQGQLPLNDFPLYLTDAVSGSIIKIERDRSQTTFKSGLSNPQGIATDKYRNIYVVEKGQSRVMKYPDSGGDGTVLIDNLDQPFIVAVDSFGEVYVTQDGPNNIVRARDRKVIGTYSGDPTALTIGVDDIFITGVYSLSQMYWDIAQSISVSQPAVVNAAVDMNGLVYVAEADADGGIGQVVRYDQRKPENKTTVINGIKGPLGIAVDSVGNVYVVETDQVIPRITYAGADGIARTFIEGPLDPRFITFTQY